MRIISGKFRSRHLQSLPGTDIRPTSDRLRETLFNVLSAGNPQALEGSVWIDLFAGSGAVGIEAISRGAEMVHFAESSKEAADLILKNLQSLGIKAGFRIVRQDALRTIQRWREGKADYIFIDPPYRMEKAYAEVLAALPSSLMVLSETNIIVEHQKKFDPGENIRSLRRVRLLKQGDAALSFYRNG